jgi:molybdopterin-binding protein
MEIFKGAVDELTLSIQENLTLGTLIANDGQEGTDFREGDQVFASIQPEDIQIVAE